MKMIFNILAFLMALISSAQENKLGQFSDYTDHYVVNDGVKLHYVKKGKGDVMIFLHGFPDFWFSWKYQMDYFSKSHTVIGVDLRGYNYSDAPQGVEQYQMSKLISDVLAIIDDVSSAPVILVANDWGGAIAWLVTSYRQDKVSRLIACNIPHPLSLGAYLSKHPATSEYTKKLKSDSAASVLSVDQLMISSGANKSDYKNEYKDAFERSNFEAMTNYYKASYPNVVAGKTGNANTQVAKIPPPPPITSPVLIIHGLEDKAFPPGSLNDHWEWVQGPITIQTIPGNGHFIQRERPELVKSLIDNWLSVIIPVR